MSGSDFASSHRLILGFSFALLLILLSAPSSAEGQTYEDFKLLASDGAGGDRFSYSVAVSGDVALIGAFHDDDNGSDSGSAYVFRYDSGSGTWSEEAKLLASDGTTYDSFGISVAISGDVALIGAPVDDDNDTDSGSAYVFRYDSGSGTWAEETKLLASDGAAGDYFSDSVSLSGDVALIGAYGDDDNGGGSGSAYVFRYDSGSGTWSEEAKLLASDGAASDNFGDSLSLSGDTALIGTQYNDDIGNSSGSAYIFRYDSGSGTWAEETKLLASDGWPYEQFGCSVAVSGDTALVGALSDDGSAFSSAYLFRYSAGSGTWSEEAKLLASDAEEYDGFGAAVALSGETALIGAPGDDDNGSSSGSAYMFHYDGASGMWNEEAKLLASDGTADDFFGASVALSGDTALIGAYYGNASGSAYLYHFDLSARLDMKANGADGIVILHAGEQLVVTLDIDTRLDNGTPTDLWVYRTLVNMDLDWSRKYDGAHDNAPSLSAIMGQGGTISYGYYGAPVWLPGLNNVYLSEGLFDLSTTILNITLGPQHVGMWSLWVMQDDNPNGIPDGVEDSDSVAIMVLP